MKNERMKSIDSLLPVNIERFFSWYITRESNEIFFYTTMLAWGILFYQYQELQIYTKLNVVIWEKRNCKYIYFHGLVFVQVVFPKSGTFSNVYESSTQVVSIFKSTPKIQKEKIK